MAVRSSFPIPARLLEWVTSAKHYWITFAERRSNRQAHTAVWVGHAVVRPLAGRLSLVVIGSHLHLLLMCGTPRLYLAKALIIIRDAVAVRFILFLDSTTSRETSPSGVNIGTRSACTAASQGCSGNQIAAKHRHKCA